MELQLGDNKKVTLTPWKSKTKKDFIKIFKQKEESVSQDDIVKVLVLPYIDTKNVYYSSDELQFILINLRKISIEDTLEFGMECANPECGKDFDVFTTLDEITHYSPGKYPSTIDNVTWRDLNNADSLQNVIKKYSDEIPHELEMLIHIESYNDKVISNINTIMSIVDELSLKELSDLEDSFVSVKPKISIEQEVTCTHCNVTDKYSFDIIPTFFDPLLPKDL